MRCGLPVGVVWFTCGCGVVWFTCGCGVVGGVCLQHAHHTLAVEATRSQ